MVEVVKIPASIFEDLQAAHNALDVLTKTLYATRETNSRLTASSKFEFGSGAFIKAFDACVGDIEKLRNLQEARRIGIIELEIRAYNVAELEGRVESASYQVKQLIRQALDYHDKHGRQEIDLPMAISRAIIVRAVQAIQALNKWNSAERRGAGGYASRRDRDECEQLVRNTLSVLSAKVPAAVGNRRNGFYEHDSVFAVDCYKPEIDKADSDNYSSRNWQHDAYNTLTVSVLPRNFEQVAPDCAALHAVCNAIVEAEAGFLAALEALRRSSHGNDFNSKALTLMLARAGSADDLTKVQCEREGQGRRNLFEYVYFENLLVAALHLRQCRAEAARLIQKAIGEVKAISGKRDYELDRSGNHFTAGVFVLYCADVILCRSGRKLHSVGANAAFMQRFGNMQAEVKSQFDALATFAREKMF